MADESKWKRFKPSIGWFAIITSFYAIAAPFIYLNGTAFHEGYLDYFHLQESMFPIDTPTTFIQALMAWMLYITKAPPSVASIFVNHWAIVGVVVIAAIVAVALILMPSAKPAAEPEPSKVAASPPETDTAISDRKEPPAVEAKPSIPASDSPTAPPPHLSLQQRIRNFLDLHPGFGEVRSWLKRFLSSASRVVVVAYWGFTGLYFTFFFGLLLLMFQFTPFTQVGRDLAKKDDHNGFKDSPEVTLQAPDGTKSKYRIIECYGLFCAVYQNRHAYAVPASAVTWAAMPDEPPIATQVKPVPLPGATKA